MVEYVCSVCWPKKQTTTATAIEAGGRKEGVECVYFSGGAEKINYQLQLQWGGGKIGRSRRR